MSEAIHSYCPSEKGESRLLKTKTAFILINIFLVVSILGCSSEEPKKINDEIDYTHFYRTNIESSNKLKVNQIDISYSKEVGKGLIAQVIFFSDSIKYEAIILSNLNDSGRPEIVDINTEKVDTTVPFTHMEMAGGLEDVVYQIYAGSINDDDITDIELTLLNDTVISVKKSELDTYSYVRLNDPDGRLRSLEGFNSKGKSIYKY